jgi:hypothetical protein
MEEIKKEFIPYELALRLKTLGYNEPCMVYFEQGILKRFEPNFLDVQILNSDFNNRLEGHHLSSCSAPTWQSVFKWFRERDFHTTIESYHCLGNDKPFGLGIDQKINGIWDYVDYSGDGNFDTYEDAQIKAIESILEIMEKKTS